MGFRCGLFWGAIRGGRRMKLVNAILFSVLVLFGQGTFTLWHFFLGFIGSSN